MSRRFALMLRGVVAASAQVGEGLAAARAMSRELGAPEMVWGSGWPVLHEETAELQWPLNLRVFDRMRRTDGQIRAGLGAIRMPIEQTTYRLVGSRVRPAVQAFCEQEIGLVEDADGHRQPRDGGVDFDQLIRTALLMLPLGFSALEKWADIGPPDPGLNVGLGPEVAHLGLSPRLPRSVEYIDVNPNGSLIGIRQWIRRGAPAAYPAVSGQPMSQAAPTPTGWTNASGFLAPGGDMALVPIPAASLVMFVNEREGADWAGQSLLRSAYKHWLIKDFLLRVDANAADRNGTGLPVVTYDPNKAGQRARALAIASAVRTGDEAGVALPDDMSLALLGVTGKTHDTLASINYHDQAIGRAFLEMFLNLGHDGGLGHGSLGATFVDIFLLSIRAILRNIEQTITHQVIRDLVRWNFGPNEPYPSLVADDPTSESTPTAEALQALAASGLLIGDPGVRAEIRRRFGMPPEDQQAVTIPFLLPRGVTDPDAAVQPTFPPGTGPIVLPNGDIWTPPAAPAGPPAHPAIPARPAPMALPAGGTGAAAVDRRGATLAAGLPVGVLVAGGILPGVVAGVLSAGEVLVDVAGVRASFTPDLVQAAGRITPPPPPDPLTGLLERTHALSERLAALAAGNTGPRYADPGYQPDSQPRYDLSTADHCRAALAYIARPENRRPYTARQLQLIESRIRAGCRQFGIDAASLAPR